MPQNVFFPRKQTTLLRFSLLVLALCCFLLVIPHAEAAQTAEVNGTNVNARQGPSTSYDAIGQVNTGEKYTVLGKEGNWYKLQLKGGAAWVSAQYLVIRDDSSGSAVIKPATGSNAGQVGAAEAVCTATITAADVNLRFGPGTAYRKLGQANKGDNFPVLAKSGDWYKLSASNGSAWVAGWLVELKNPPQPGKNPGPSTGSGAQTGVTNVPPAANDSTDAAAAGTEVGAAAPSDSIGGRTAVINANEVNVRSGPGTDYRVIAMANQGDRFTVNGKSGEWYMLDLNRGAGWVAEWLVDVPSEASRGGTPEYPGNEVGASGGESDTLSIEARQTGERAIINLKSKGKIGYDIFTLDSPSRLVVDLTLEGFTSGSAKEIPESVQVDKGPVSTLRTGWLDGDNCLRLVFDLNKKAHYIVTELNDKSELALEIFVPDLGGSLAGKTIFLDPGHGGQDPGAIGPSGLHESSVTIEIANKAAELLRGQGATVYMSRTGNSAVGQYDRARMANEVNADVFVSIHINSNELPDKWGMSTYSYTPPGDAAANIQKRKRLADSLQLELSETLRLANLGLFQARFAVLCETTMPAVLLEIGFISNPEEEKLLKEDSFREQAAQAITRGLGYYFSER